MKRKIILASTSPRRRGLLQQIGLEFEVVPSNFEEDMSLELGPEELCKNFAEGKASDVAKTQEDAIVIGVDTFFVFENKNLGKPFTKENAIERLKTLSGKEVQIYSGICIIDSKSKEKIVDFEISKIQLKELSEEEIKFYVESEEPLDKAGALAIQGLGGIFVKKIDGCYSNIIGLPLNNLYKNLQKLGVNIFDYDGWKNLEK